MIKKYRVRVTLGRQEDGLWRAEVPGLAGCFVDAPTLAEAIADIQEVIAMALDERDEHNSKVDDGVVRLADDPEEVVLPVLVHEFDFAHPKHRGR